MQFIDQSFPPRGYLFTTRAHGLLGNTVLLGERLEGWFPDEADEEFCHAGIVDTCPFIWEADEWRGVVRRQLGPRENLRFWHPPREAELLPQDYERAFAVVKAHAGRRYDWRWILTLGRRPRPSQDICTELVKAFIDALTQRIGGWAGGGIKKFVPNHLPRLLGEVTLSRGAEEER